MPNTLHYGNNLASDRGKSFETAQPYENPLTGKITIAGFGRLQLLPLALYPNPGYPLPGHVMTSPGTSPGTPRWLKLGMDGNPDW